MPDHALHEKIGAFSADINTLKKGHESILDKMDKTEEKREVQFKAIDERLDKQKWGITLTIITSALAPFVASSAIGKEVLTSLVVYIQHLFA